MDGATWYDNEFLITRGMQARAETSPWGSCGCLQWIFSVCFELVFYDQPALFPNVWKNILDYFCLLKPDTVLDLHLEDN